jgi:hypothetical protein
MKPFGTHFHAGLTLFCIFIYVRFHVGGVWSKEWMRNICNVDNTWNMMKIDPLIAHNFKFKWVVGCGRRAKRGAFQKYKT